MISRQPDTTIVGAKILINQYFSATNFLPWSARCRASYRRPDLRNNPRFEQITSPLGKPLSVRGQAEDKTRGGARANESQPSP